MDQEGGVLKIKIYGTEYRIKNDPETDSNYILEVASYLDQKMREIDQSMMSRSALKVAILAALNITDELFQERVRDKAPRTDVNEKIHQLSEVLNKALSGHSSDR